jgi:hypothetical protein
MPREGGKLREDGNYSRRYKTAEAAVAHRAWIAQGEQDYLLRLARREAARAKRSPPQQLAVLDKRLGTGQGAYKERMRLQMQLREQAKAENTAKVQSERQEAKPEKTKKVKAQGRGKVEKPRQV